MTKRQKLVLQGTSVFGLAAIVLATIMLFTFPSSAELAEGFRTPIIAFEFAKTEADLSFLSGNSELSQLHREKMDAGHAWDMAFPFAYGGFIALMLLQLAMAGRRFAAVGIVFAILIIPFDIHENLVLLDITHALAQSAPIDTLLDQLYIATWLKWGALGISLAVLALGFTAQRLIVAALFTAAAAVSIGVCWVLDAQPASAETMSALTALFFLIFVIHACRKSCLLLRRTEQP